MRTHVNFEYPGSRLSIHQLRLAMRRYYYDSTMSGIGTESFSYKQIRNYLDPARNMPDHVGAWRCSLAEFPTLFSREAQICPEPLGLYVWIRDIIILETWEDIRKEYWCQWFPINYFQTCPHTQLSSELGRFGLVKIKDASG
jgi:hypothetical protein